MFDEMVKKDSCAAEQVFQCDGKMTKLQSEKIKSNLRPIVNLNAKKLHAFSLI